MQLIREIISLSLRFGNALEYVDGWNPSNNTILDVRSCNAGMGGVTGQFEAGMDHPG